MIKIISSKIKNILHLRKYCYSRSEWVQHFRALHRNERNVLAELRCTILDVVTLAIFSLISLRNLHARGENESKFKRKKY